MSLREAIKDLHDAAEAHPFVARLMSGEMSEGEYRRFLTNIHPAYAALEVRAYGAGLLEGLEGIERAARIWDDLGESPEGTVLQSVHEYMIHLTLLPEPLLMAHLYVRHMGDMFGGQMIKSKVPSKGSMYDFENRKELIDTLRSRLTDDLADEAVVAFQFVLRLFDELEHERNLQSA